MFKFIGESKLHTTILNLPENRVKIEELLNEIKTDIENGEDICDGGLVDSVCEFPLNIPESFWGDIEKWEIEKDDCFYINICLDVKDNIGRILNIKR